jgi:hypothetical protein
VLVEGCPGSRLGKLDPERFFETALDRSKSPSKLRAAPSKTVEEAVLAKR